MNSPDKPTVPFTFKRRPSAGRTRYRLPWNTQSAIDGISLNSSSGVSSTTSPRTTEGALAVRDSPRENNTESNRKRREQSQTGWIHRNSLTRFASGDESGPSGSHSVPTSGRISPLPVSDKSLSLLDRKGSLHRSSIGLAPFPPTGSTGEFPARRNTLVPLKKSSLKQSATMNFTESSIPSPVSVLNFSPPLLPIRATIARQSSRKRPSRISADSNRFGFRGVIPPVDCSQRKLPPDTSTAEQPPLKDYDPDDYVDVEKEIADDDDDDDDEDGTDEDDAVGRGNVSARNQFDNQQFGVSSSRLISLASGAPLCRSVDSEISEVSSIRSAASHRRAMRLFQEAEQKRQTEESDRKSLCQPLHVSVTESSCPAPVLAPAITPAVPIQRALPPKVISKRRGTLTNQSFVNTSQAVSCGAIANEAKTTGASGDALNRLGSSPLPAKYNPYAGATFRENQDYIGLVIGRSTGSQQPLSTPDLHRLSHQSNARRPLKGQHGIYTNLSPQSNGGNIPSDPPSIAPPPAATSSSAINVVGKSVFEPHPASLPTPVLSPSDQSPITDPDERPIRPSAQYPMVGEEGPLSEEADSQSNTKLRQQYLRKKSKELQKLRQGSASKTVTKMQYIVPDHFSIDDDGNMNGNQTWPPLNTNNTPNHTPPMSSEASPTNDQAGSSAGLPPKHRARQTADPNRPAPRNLSTAHRIHSGSCMNIEAELRATNGTRESRNHTNTTRDGHPLLKGQSTLNLRTTSSLSEILQLINTEDWEAKVSGLESLAQVALEPGAFPVSHPIGGTASAGSVRRQPQGLLTADGLAQAVQAVITECRNLRSQVSRQAVQTLSTLFHGLGKAMDPHVEICVRVLLGKTGEAGAAFLRDQVAVALDELSQATSPCRSLTAFMQHGLGHKNPSVRLQTALQVSRIIETVADVEFTSRLDNTASVKTVSGLRRSGSKLSSWSSMNSLHANASAFPSYISGMLDKLVVALSQFLTDGNQETRYYGRRLLNSIKSHPDFDRTVRKQLNGQALRAVQDAIDLINLKGVGEPPVTSAGSRRRGFSPAPSVSASGSTSAATTIKS